MHKLKELVLNNKVVLLFGLLCIAAIYTAQNPLTFVAGELFTRIGRNGFMVLALLIPVLAGMGLNFGIVIGAIAAQIAVFWTVYWGYTGSEGFLLCLLLSTPIAIFFGWLVGRLFNKMKGAEMIAGLVLGYFADGLYQLFFLYIIGGIIPVYNERLIISGGIGVKNTIDLTGNLKYSLDNVPMLHIVKIVLAVLAVVALIKIILGVVKKNPPGHRSWIVLGAAPIAYALTFVPAIKEYLSSDRLLLLHAVLSGLGAVIIWQSWLIVSNKIRRRRKEYSLIRPLVYMAIAVGGCLLTYIKPVEKILLYVKIPVTTYLCIVALCLFNAALLKTRLGQNMRTVGQSQTVANTAGINVDTTRIIAMIISTTLACWGQLIYLQNIGTFSTYGAHTQVGQYAIAALLVGGASVKKASSKQAVIGGILFHTLFIVAPQAGKQLFNNAQLGEYFRVFVAYGVIAVSLAMHAWKDRGKTKEPNRNRA
ncbi:MAG: ABC transporter permease [Eubacteriales bacterium]|nr:ABC transporter permease [Eubacteriales bacterium]MDD3073174.1 ABC transporter permease [Eubacteriales bacterium]MDD4078331.1 ABC transporter permease [Eubacteriales bacterium]MDD4768492.1 ABC transporter permease [Eubacteriales bacterium]